MALTLPWLPPEAPYMPIAVAGLLSVLPDTTTATWRATEHGDALTLDGTLAAEEVAGAIHAAPWPDPDGIAWPDGGRSQGLKPTLKASADPVGALQRTIAAAPAAEAALLRAIVTDAVRDNDGVPGRSRLLRGVKADLASVAKPPKRVTPDSLAAELRDGPEFRSGSSGLGLGLVPEVQTFGGTTGQHPEGVGAFSPLLYLLLWHGLLALPPVGVARGTRRAVGGPLVSAPDVLCWPVWRFPVGLVGLRSLLGLAEVHVEVPDAALLPARGIVAVFRARAVQINTAVAVFRWGERVM